MLELVLGLLTGWLAVETCPPTSFGQFVLFVLLWAVYFVIGKLITDTLIKSMKPIPIRTTSKPKIDFNSSAENIMLSLFGDYKYPDRRTEYLNRQIKSNLFKTAFQHPEIDYTQLWLLYEDGFGNLTCDIATHYTNNPELEIQINFIIRGTVAMFESNNPKIENISS